MSELLSPFIKLKYERMKREIQIKFCKIIISSMAFFLLISTPFNVYATTVNTTKSLRNSQSYTEFKGVVIDSDTKEKLIFADVSLNGSNIRTVTNKEGRFLLKVPNDQLDKMITISFLGYNNKVIPLEELNNKINTISLKISVTELNIVKINEFKNALLLVKAALNNQNKNYHSNRIIMTAFYRETIRKGKKNASLSEAVLHIYKHPNKSSKIDYINLIKSRKKTNYKRLDTIALKLMGGPYTTLYTDLIKYPEYMFNSETYQYYDFTMELPTQINDQQVYVVKFKQKANVHGPYYYGKLFIDSEALTLVSAISSLNLDNKKLASKMFVRKKPRKVNVYPTEVSYRVDYKTKNGKWYFGYSNIKLAFKVNWKNKFFNSNYKLDIEMAITDWEINDSEKLNPKKRLSRSSIFVDEASGFSDPEFWGEYNIIEPEKSIESAINKIAKQLKQTK